jgi:antirestriction protein ArdC
MSTTAGRDLYAETTARIIAALEQGAAPWVKPWFTGIDTLPMNASSRRLYRGINALLLGIEASTHGYPLNRWLTYRQALELGGQVRKGEHGTIVVLWRLRRVAATSDVYPEPEVQDLHERVIPLLRAFTVFNLAQVEGVPAPLQAVQQHSWEPEARAEELLLMSGATIRHGGSRAFFRPGDDEIHLPPPRAFPDAGRYYATALHELTHWTSQPGRCNRQLGQRFGDDAYAAEELIAEMGAAFLCAHCRIDGELHHAGYLASWLKVLRTDKRAIFVAATRAQQAADYLLRLLQPPDREVAALAA